MNEKYFKVYKSAAGSGKTYILVKEYLKIVLQNPWKYNKILAVTFTNKAVNEMKNRIIESLSVLMDSKTLQSSSLEEELLSELNLEPDQLKKNAHIVLQNILHHFSDFSVSTIDSFTHRVIKAFAFDLKLPLVFEIELDGETIVSQAVDLLIDKIGTDESITNILLAFTYSKLREDKSFYIESDLKQQGLQLLKEDIEQHLLKLKTIGVNDFLAISERQKSEMSILKSEIKKIGELFFEKINEFGLSDADFYQGKRGIYGLFHKMSQFDGAAILLSQTIQTIIESENFAKPKVSKAQMGSINRITPFILEKVKQFLDIQELYLSKKLFFENIYTLAVLNEINQIIQLNTMDYKTLHISEFNKKISRIILEEPIPYIYERLGEQYQHFLIDEFQDTSVLQWQNLLPLVENGLSQNLFSMIVGDSKQAIYRFRQGEVEQFETLPLIYQKQDNPFLLEREKTLVRQYELEVLNHNYRSRRTLVEFNNDFFKEVGSQYLSDNYQRIYAGNESEGDLGVFQIPVKEGGYLSISFLEKDQYEQATCQQVYQTIKQLLGKGFEMSDICILTRNNKELSILGDYLSQETVNEIQLALTSDESFKLINSAKVRFIIALLQYIYDSSLQSPQIHILHYLAIEKKISYAQIIHYFTEKKDILFEELLSNAGYAVSEIATSWVSIYDVCEKIIRMFYLNESPDLYITAFLNAIMVYSKKNEQSIGSFLEWFSEKQNKLTAKSSEDMNAIHLMTIHKSKGLGFPIVIFPFADCNSNSNTSLWVDTEASFDAIPTGIINIKREVESTLFKKVYKEEKDKADLDLVNVLYVALTRAKDELYIICKKPSENDEVVSYPLMFKQFLANKGLWKEDQLHYEFGNQQDSGIPPAKRNEEKVLNVCVSSDWTERTLINKREQLTKELIFSEVYAEKGMLFREALKKIKMIDDCANIVHDLSKKEILKVEEKDIFICKLKQWISHPSVSCFFQKEDIIKTDKELLVNGMSFHVDRLITTDKKTWIVNFKTGEAKEEHLIQIQKYGKILQRMKYNKVKGFVIYLNHDIPEVIEAL